jgi:hypothetical protein
MVRLFIIKLVNDSKSENIACSDFFLPLYNKCRVMIAGSGQQCLVKTFICKCLMKPQTEDEKVSIISTDKRNCDCCLII